MPGLDDDLVPDPVGDPGGSPDTWVFEEARVAAAATRASVSGAEGPIVDAAIFGMASASQPQPRSRRELHGGSHTDRRRRLLTLVLVVALIALIGGGIAAVTQGDGDSSAVKPEVKVVGTALPTTTPSTRPATTVPATAAPTAPPATAAPAAHTNTNNNTSTTPVRTNPPVVVTDPPPPPPTDPPPPPPTEPPTTTPSTTSPPPTTTLPCVPTATELCG
jgi:hypothetical protein